MDTFQLLLDVLGPVVLIVACGALFGGRLGLDIPTLSKLAYWILGPAFVFDIFVTTSLSADTAIRLVLAGLGGFAASAAVAAALVRFTGLHLTSGRAATMTSAYGNVGNAGLAICAFALGDDALAQAGVLMITIVFLGTLVSVWLGTRQTQNAFAAARRAVLSPMVVAAIVGFLVNIAGWSAPLAVERAVSTTARGLIPVMLLTLGLQLATTTSLQWMRSTSVVAVAKLLVAPAAAAAIAALLGLAGDDLGVVILQSAMPPAVFCMVLAIEHDLEAEQTTNDVVATTLASLITLPVALALVN